MYVEAERLRARRRMLLALSLERQGDVGAPGRPAGRGTDERGPSAAAVAAAEGRRPSEAA